MSNEETNSIIPPRDETERSTEQGTELDTWVTKGENGERPKSVVKNRMTIVETVYFHAKGKSPIPIDSRYSRELETTEQFWQRECTVGEEWQPLDLKYCWLNDKPIAAIHIKNEEGYFLNVKPTQGERDAAMAKVIEVGQACISDVLPVTDWLIPPRETFRGTPVRLDTLYVRCRSGQARYTLTVIPG